MSLSEKNGGRYHLNIESNKGCNEMTIKLFSYRLTLSVTKVETITVNVDTAAAAAEVAQIDLSELKAKIAALKADD